MKISIISDTHIKSNSSDEYQILLNFLKHPKVKSSTDIFLLGDIFDLMVGSHKKYLEIYRDYFILLKELSQSNIKIYYFEGNHDFNLKNLFSHASIKINYYKKKHSFLFNNKTFLISHGDDLSYDSLLYKAYSTFVRSSFGELLADKIVPFWLLQKFGSAASNISRKQNRHDSDERFLNILALNYQDKDFIVCGHTHIKRILQLKKKGPVYINVGLPSIDKSFVYLDEQNSITFYPLLSNT